MASSQKLTLCFYFSTILVTWLVDTGATASSGEVYVPQNISLLIDDDWVAPEYILKDYPYYICGQDFEGRPVIVAEAGHWNFRKAVEAGGEYLENLDRHIAKGMNIVKKLALRTSDIEFSNSALNDSPGGAVVIVDMADFDYRQSASPRTLLYMLSIARAASELADLISYAFFLNVNYAAEVLINLARPALGPLFERFEVSGTNKERWLPNLLEKIPKKQLPPWYGGEKNFKPVAIFG